MELSTGTGWRESAYIGADLSLCCTFGFSSVVWLMKLLTFMRRYPTEAAARRWYKEARWPDGPVCPRCGVMHRSSSLSTRPGQFTCLDCRHRYSITSGTALHNTKLPLRTWLIAMYLVSASSKGISAMKLSQWLGVSYKTAWHLGHRIRSMMVRFSRFPLAYGKLTA